MSKTVEDWLSIGNKIAVLPLGYSGEAQRHNFQKSKKKDKTKPVVGLVDVRKKPKGLEAEVRASQIELVADWCMDKAGREKALCLEMKVSSDFMVRIISGSSPCTKGVYKNIVEAMKVIEKNEQLKNNA